MFCTLTISRYPRYLGFFGLLSMALFRLPLSHNRKVKFWKLMGCGKNGGFDIRPDLNQWGLLFIGEEAQTDLPPFIHSYWKFFRCEIKQLIIQPISGHGLWDGKQGFGELPAETAYAGPVAVLTRATIWARRLRNFW